MAPVKYFFQQNSFITLELKLLKRRSLYLRHYSMSLRHNFKSVRVTSTLLDCANDQYAFLPRIVLNSIPKWNFVHRTVGEKTQVKTGKYDPSLMSEYRTYRLSHDCCFLTGLKQAPLIFCFNQLLQSPPLRIVFVNRAPSTSGFRVLP